MCICVFSGWFRRDACFGRLFKSLTSAMHHRTIVLHLLPVPVSSGVSFFHTSNPFTSFVSVWCVIFRPIVLLYIRQLLHDVSFNRLLFSSVTPSWPEFRKEPWARTGFFAGWITVHVIQLTVSWQVDLSSIWCVFTQGVAFCGSQWLHLC